MKTRKAKASDGIREGYILNCPLSEPTPAVASSAMEGEARHTQTPWEMKPGTWVIRGEDKIGVCEMQRTGFPEQASKNAALIIRAVNAHQELIDSVNELRKALEPRWMRTGCNSTEEKALARVRLAIAKAEGK